MLLLIGCDCKEKNYIQQGKNKQVSVVSWHTDISKLQLSKVLSTPPPPSAHWYLGVRRQPKKQKK